MNSKGRLDASTKKRPAKSDSSPISKRNFLNAPMIPKSLFIPF
ncbi:hypothetical protein FEM08_24510 [Flavobacterium gilvum]|nr:hypothetical protein FEM08_24510 [Flavobacterium gilvum]